MSDKKYVELINKFQGKVHSADNADDLRRARLLILCIIYCSGNFVPPIMHDLHSLSTLDNLICHKLL